MTNSDVLKAIARISLKEDTTSDMKDQLVKIQDEVSKMNPDIQANGGVVREFMVASGYMNQQN